jgi:hypothetical protein
MLSQSVLILTQLTLFGKQGSGKVRSGDGELVTAIKFKVLSQSVLILTQLTLVGQWGNAKVMQCEKRA